MPSLFRDLTQTSTSGHARARSVKGAAVCESSVLHGWHVDDGACASKLCRVRRSSALAVLDVVMAVAPAQVAAAYTAPALHHFADLLSQGGRSASIASRSLPSLLKVRRARDVCCLAP